MTKVRRWGYAKDDAQIFELPLGADLPPGYYDSPAKVPKEAPPAPLAEALEADEPGWGDEVQDAAWHEEREQLLADARELGIETRGPQSNARLRRKIGEAKIMKAIDEAEPVTA